MIHLWNVSGTIPVAMSEAALLALACVCRFLLVSCTAYGLCWFLSRLATSAAARFTIWLLYIVSMAGYWLAALALVFRALLLHLTKLGTAFHGVPAPGNHPRVPLLSIALSDTLASSIGTWLPLVFAAYLSVLAGLVLLGILQRKQLARALRFRLVPCRTVKQMFHALATELGIQNCQLWLMPGIATPAAIHWLQPAVCLPMDCTDATPDLESILRHELCHVRRCDNLWEAVARLGCDLIFFHPLLHRALASLRFEREVACDAEVVRSHPDKRDRYADTLVRFGWIAVQSRQSHSRFADVQFRDARFPKVRFAAHAGILNARVRSILAGEPLYSRRSQRQRTLCSAAGVWVFAAAMPACWIGIDRTQSPVSAGSIAAIATPRQHKLHHTFRAARTVAAGNVAALRAAQPAAAIAGPGLLPGLAPAALPQVRYQSVHDEPQLAQLQSPADPDHIDESSSSTASQHIPGSRRATLSPSTVSVIVGAAIVLGHLGLDHDHDRD